MIAEKAFVKVQYQLTIKIPSKLKIDENLLNLIKTLSWYIHNKILKNLTPATRKKTGVSATPLLLNTVLEVVQWSKG